MIRNFKITDITEDKIHLEDSESGKSYVGDPAGFSDDLKVGDDVPCNALEHADGTKVTEETKAGVLARMLGRDKPLEVTEADKKAVVAAIGT